MLKIANVFTRWETPFHLVGKCENGFRRVQPKENILALKMLYIAVLDKVKPGFLPKSIAQGSLK